MIRKKSSLFVHMVVNMYPDTLVGNLSIWSVTPNESSFLSKIGHNEKE